MVQTNLNAVVAPGNIEYNVDDLVSYFLNEEHGLSNNSNDNISIS